LDEIDPGRQVRIFLDKMQVRDDESGCKPARQANRERRAEQPSWSGPLSGSARLTGRKIIMSKDDPLAWWRQQFH
jgi:hypothetical protein